jgi:hypothetical protein
LRKKTGPILAGVAFAAVALSAHAAVKFSATREGFFTTSNESFTIPLNDLGATTVKFNLPAAKKVLLTYTAVCAVTGSSSATLPYVHLDIIVNGSTVAPTRGDFDSFCSGNHTSVADGYTTNTVAMAISGKKGANTVTIVGGAKYSPGYVAIGNSSLVISD